MSGIDKIIGQIEEDTRAVCEGITAQADAKAARIIAEAEKQAEYIRSSSEEKLASAVLDIKKRGDSAAELEERKTLLYTKQSIISDMLAIGIERVKSLPDDEYFALILRMIAKYSLPQDGVIRFGRRDADRLPAGFIKEANAVSNGKLVLSDECAAIGAGFILIYGGIEENCSFDAIFAGEDEVLKDKAGKLLF